MGNRVVVEAFGLNSSPSLQHWSRMREWLGLDVNVPELTYHQPDRGRILRQWLANYCGRRQERSVNN
ncbi:hypothetical protein [Mycobacterium leprae]|uniref:hypothetical protein n=1 Tax=Mycobacterium leprae TaxID=1769 RepID=UPI001E3FBBB6|nr:hypothetical protein [Mycobacterium leprae]